MTVKESFQGIWKKMKIGFGIVLVVGLAFVTYFLMGHYSDGYRGGSLIKISQKGIVFKTMEGQLNVGTFLDNGVNKPMSPIWDFSVKNDQKLFDSLNHAILTNQRVKLHYKEMFVKLPWRGENVYIVDEVELVD